MSVTPSAPHDEPDRPDVLVERRGRLGLITLNRPQALNALTHAMVDTVAAALDDWAEDDAISTVAVVGAGDRGLCAGGDIVGLYRDVTEGDGMRAAAFWRAEYAMNARINSYSKPFVAIQDGIVLGGGVGISAFGSHRVVTERSRLGFPEVTIGFIPDVGGTWLLSRAPGEVGTRLALSAETVGPADAIWIGLSDTFVPQARIPELLSALETDGADAAVTAFAADPGPGDLGAQRSWTDAAFSADTIEGILGRLRDSDSPEASAIATVIAEKSPIALAVTLEALRRARSLPSLPHALNQDYRVSRHSSGTHDFAEGIRALVIDKDRNPQWEHRDHGTVTHTEVAAFFARPADGDLNVSESSSKETAS